MSYALFGAAAVMGGVALGLAFFGGEDESHPDFAIVWPGGAGLAGSF